MTTNYHTPITTGAAANASVVNAPLSSLDTALGDTNSTVTAHQTELVTARAGYPNLDARLDALIATGGNVATLTNGAASAGQKVVTVDSTTGFIDPAYVVYTLAGGTLEYNQIDAINSGTQITLTTNIGTGGIADNTYFSMISPSEKAASVKVNVGNGVSQTLDVAMEAALGGVFDIRSYGASDGASAAANTTAIQAALDAMETAGGGTLFIPDGEFAVTQLTIPNGATQASHGAEHYIIRGNGISSKLTSATASPIFVWQENDKSAKTSFYNVCAENTVAGGSIMQWATSDVDAYRLALHVEDCVFEYTGALVSHGNVSAIDFDGLIASSFINVQIRGGSPVGGGAFIGWGMHIKGSSTCHFDQVYFCGGNSGRGLWLEEGGNHIITGMRCDGGSRYGPTYYLDDTQANTFIQLRGEGADSDPFLLIENSHTLQFYDTSVPEVSYGVNNNIIEIDNSHHVQFFGGRSGSQQALGGTGKSITISANSNYIRFRDFNITSAGSCTADVSNLSTGFVQLDLLDGNTSGSYRNPPTAVRYIGVDHHGTVQVGENGTNVEVIIHATASWNPAEIADGATDSTTVTIPNAAATDTIIGLSYTSIGSANWTLRGHLYDDTGTIKAKVWLTNNTGGAVNLADGVVTVTVGRFPYTHI